MHVQYSTQYLVLFRKREIFCFHTEYNLTCVEQPIHLVVRSVSFSETPSIFVFCDLVQQFILFSRLDVFDTISHQCDIEIELLPTNSNARNTTTWPFILNCILNFSVFRRLIRAVSSTKPKASQVQQTYFSHSMRSIV